MHHRTALLHALEAITTARREYQGELDDHVAAKLTTAPATGDQDEQDEQSLASIVRLLGEAAKAVRDAVSCGDRLEERVRAPVRGEPA